MLRTTLSTTLPRRTFLKGALGAGATLALTLAGCSTSSDDDSSDETDADAAEETEETTPATVTIESLDANGETIELEVPYQPERVATLDMAALDIIDAIGAGDTVVGSSSTSLDYLQDYVTSDDISNLGTIKEADLEAVAACEPEVIFIGGRLSESYDTLSEIAPVVYLATDSDLGVVESTRANATAIASIFGLEDEVDSLMTDYEERIEALSEVAEGHTALVGLFTSGSLNVLGNDGRCSLIGNEVGFENLADGEVTSTHGNEVSFETIVAEDPEYIFVLNRDAAIGSDGADQAQEVVENELTQQTQAYQNGNIIYLANPAVWYTAEGGIQALGVMLSDLEDELL